MIIWQSTVTDDETYGINLGAIDSMIDELNDAVAQIVESYQAEYPS